MTLEQQVCSLELAKKLKELGVKQQSLFVWAEAPRGVDIYLSDAKGLHDEKWSAFTVAELGEMLPFMLDIPAGTAYPYRDIYSLGVERWRSKDGIRHKVYYGENRANILHDEIADTEADARTKMLIYVIENKLIPVQ